jgi:hypothetical protein
MKDVFTDCSRQVFSFQYEQFDTYVSLGLDRGQYFALLDRYVYDDTFADALGRDCANKLAGSGGYRYASLGHVITDSLEEVARNCNLTDGERDMLGVEVRKLGLRFKSDTTAWQEYRRTKPDDFRLLRLEKLNCRFSAKVRRYFSHSPSQPSPAS